MTRSIGTNTPTGEPENGPRGPYITEDDDGTHRGKKPARASGSKPVEPAPPKMKGPAQP